MTLVPSKCPTSSTTSMETTCEFERTEIIIIRVKSEFDGTVSLRIH